MDSASSDLDPKTLRRAWEQLCGSGTASPTIARHLRVGIRPFLDAFEAHYLGPANLGQGSKLVLGKNGEGKTHLLLCLRELALRNGHAVALIEPKTSAVGDSAFVFAQEVLRRIETSDLAEADDGGARIPALLRAAVQRKRAVLVGKGLDPEALLPRWADGLRDKDLHPFGLAAALAEGIEAAIEDNPERLREAAARIAFEEMKISKKQAEVDGGRLLQSLPGLVKLLGFESLIILLDEAETAVERAGSARRRQFLKFLRFLNDQVANQADERAPAMVIIGCTDDFWPEQFAEYYALQSRLADPGKDEPKERQGLKPKALVRLNKVWVRETFRGDEPDYEELGTALLDLAGRLYPDLDRSVQSSNVSRFARVASSDAVKKEVKRNFIKALCQDIESQMASDTQRVIEEKDARKALDAAVKAIQEDDAQKGDG
jgi:hypothetical protein